MLDEYLDQPGITIPVGLRAPVLTHTLRSRDQVPPDQEITSNDATSNTHDGVEMNVLTLDSAAGPKAGQNRSRMDDMKTPLLAFTVE